MTSNDMGIEVPGKDLDSHSSSSEELVKDLMKPTDVAPATQTMSFQEEKDMRNKLALEFSANYAPPTKKHSDEDFDVEKYPLREVTIQLPWLEDPISFNPITSLFGIGCLWGLAIWCMIDPDGSSASVTEIRSDITLYFSWLFIITRCVFLFFLVFIAWKYGHIKMAPTPDEEPEFSTGSYFMMIFAAGVAVGLFIYGASEPLFHQSSQFYAMQEFRTQDEIDLFALNITVTNWGLSAWAPYLIVAVSMGLAGHRFGLPMTFRSCFYPILGEYAWGWMGDIIDGFTIVTTVAGICTSLGLGAITIVAGFQYLGWVDDDIDDSEVTTLQNLTIWGITSVATLSVMSGLHSGVQLLSKIAFGFGMLLVTLILIMDNTKFLLNLQVQELGFYISNSIVSLNFWTDAFGQLREGEGRAIDGQAASATWMDSWMIFYQAWWVSWSAFVGLFIARISRGRTVREVISYSLIAPSLYCVLWFSVWGGVSMRQARQAMELEVLGETHFDDINHFRVSGSEFCFDVPQESVSDPNDTSKTIFENTLVGVTPVCKFDSGNFEDAAYNLMYSYSFPESFGGQGFGPTLTILYIIAVSIYFATSSDSGSLVVDHLASNGRMKHHWIQRLFWAVTEGAVATALLSAGGSNALAAVQAGSVISGFPFVIMLCYLMQSIYVFCEQSNTVHTGEFKLPVQPEFSFPIFGGVFNCFEYLLSLGSVNPHRIKRQMDVPTSTQTMEFFKALLFPYVSLYQILSVTYPRKTVSNMGTAATYAVCFYSWVGLFVAYAEYNGLRGWAWIAMICTTVMLANVRNDFRTRFNIRSNMLGDVLTSMFMYAQVLAQLRVQCMELGLPQDHSDMDLAEDAPAEGEEQPAKEIEA